MISRKPLYGGIDAPSRWLLRVRATLRMAGWNQTRTDICTFVRFRRSGEGNVRALSRIIVLRVEDLLLAADKGFQDLFAKTIKQFKTGHL